MSDDAYITMPRLNVFAKPFIRRSVLRIGGKPMPVDHAANRHAVAVTNEHNRRFWESCPVYGEPPIYEYDEKAGEARIVS